MKKIMVMALALLVGLGLAAPASATDIKIKGWFDFAFGWYSNSENFNDASSDDGSHSEDRFDALQRLRLQIDFVASENLSGTLQLEIGDIQGGNSGGDTWGGAGAGNGSGGALGADGVNVETRHMYIDWIVPETDLSLRMGLQPFALPFFANGAESGQAILDDDMAGILATYTFNEYVAVNVAWLRPWNPFIDDEATRRAFTDHDAIDLFALTLPLTFAEYGLEIIPWGLYGSIGEVDETNAHGGGSISQGLGGAWAGGDTSLGADGDAWWAGLSVNVEYWDPFFAAMDFMYGSYTSSGAAVFDANGAWLGDWDNDRDGWALAAKLGYRFECFTPTLFGWYGSGLSDADDENALDGLMPVLSPDFGFTSFGGSNNYDLFRDGVMNGNNIIGTWGIGIGLEDISLIENMTNAIRVAYFAGTNDESLARLGPFSSRDLGIAGSHLYTGKDWGLEVNLDTSYEIMEGLTLYNQIGYLHFDLDDAWNAGRTEHWDNDTDDAWEFAVGFQYAF